MDLKILQWINENMHGSNSINMFFKYVTYLGSGAIMWIVIGAIMLFFRKTRKVSIIMFAALLLNVVIVNLILKNAVGRTRPYAVDNNLMLYLEEISLKLPKDSSFPSGHSASSFVCAVVIFYYFRRMGIIALIMATLISISRLFLCVHYPSDVLCGAIFGIMAAIITIFCSEKIIKNYNDKKNRPTYDGKDGIN